ncbi:MAG: c-type cytochrome [Limisphaerales bacterium]
MSDEQKNNSQKPGDEPSANRSPAPVWIFVLVFVLLYLGAVYFDHRGGWFDAQVYAPYQSAEELEAYQPKSGAAAMLARGKQVYGQVCGICHGPDGLGKPEQFPPLAGSEWVNTKDFKRLAHIPLEGLSGTVQVQAKPWNLSMPPMGATLSDADLAGVLTYIRSSWGNKAGAVTADDIKAIRAKIGSHPTPISGGAGLEKIPQ